MSKKLASLSAQKRVRPMFALSVLAAAALGAGLAQAALTPEATWATLHNYQAGDPRFGDFDAPTLGNLTGVNVVKIGNAYLGGIALSDKGAVYTWGWNGQGQLGIGKTDQYLPARGTPQDKITTAQWTAQTYGGGYTLVDFFSNPDKYKPNYDALKMAPELTAPTTVVDVDAGYHHMIALDEQGRVWAWGYNAQNQIGKKTGAKWNFPQRVKGLPANIARVFAHHGYLDRGQSFALTTDGQLWVWGSNSGGKLGIGTTSAGDGTPVLAKFPAGTKIVDVQGGDYHNLALDDKGNVWGWGSGSYLGDGSSGTVSTPKIVKLPATAGKAVKIGVSYDNSLVLDDKHQVWQAGKIYVGPNAGNMTTVTKFQLVQVADAEPARVGYTPIAHDIGAGESVAYFVDQHGRAWAWGDGRYHGFGREGPYIPTYTNMRTAKARQFPQIIGDGDTQRTDKDPKTPSDGLQWSLDTPADGKKFGTYGFNAQHPTIYDKKYNKPGDTSENWWKNLAFTPIPKIKQILGSRSGYLILDYDGNLFRWAYDGSGTVAWGDGNDFDPQYDNMGNGRDGNFDAYCYEVMLMRGGHMPTCVPQPLPNLLTGGSTSSVGGSSTRVSDNAMVYAASREYDPAQGGSIGGWSGSLSAYAGNMLDQAVWSASVAPPRQIFTANAAFKGIPFQWGNGGLTAADVPKLPGTTPMCTNAVTGQDVDCNAPCTDPGTNPPTVLPAASCAPKTCDDPDNPGASMACPPPAEPTQADVNMMRSQPLGSVVNSQLVYVSKPTLLSLDDDYLAFAKTVNAFNGSAPHKYRQGVVYVVANDSMLHGFDAGNGTPATASGGNPGTGKELLAYVPRGMLIELRAASNGVADSHWVDGGMFSGDAQLGAGSAGGIGTTTSNNPGRWATVLAGTLGAGGPGYFVLDVTKPDAIKESDTATLARAVLIDKTDPSAAQAATLGYQSSLPVMDMYNTTRQPAQIVRINTKDAKGEWAIIMGNGYASTDGLPVLLVQSLSAAGRPLYMVKASCTAADPADCVKAGNGLSAPRPVDVDGNGTADFVYAGDLLGNLWKFDISDMDPAKWKVAYGQQPMFKAVGPGGQAQPITSAPVAVPYPSGGFMVAFGTGRNLSQSDLSDTAPNSFYALYDAQKITVSQAPLGTATPAVMASQVTLTEPPAHTFCAAAGAGGSARYGACLYPRADGPDGSLDPNTTPAALTAIPPDTQGHSITAGAMLGWYYDIPETFNGHAAKVLDNPAMMSDNVVQFFTVNVPAPAGDPGTTCDPKPVQASAELLAANYFELFTGAPANDITVTIGDTTVTYKDATQKNRIMLTFGKYVRSGTDSFVRAPGGDLIQYNAKDAPGRRSGWRINR